ncbi:hypothetical protein E2C01_100581 [Portunus trituberculatus]|uniref:Uncharacterized protein n=1 Tax=Portunus trituberculatus TaxID=210409 RepID=A0A5B7KCK6_PORTR|nr:hypothetical protein [Portunus trituberculatus]
MMTSIPASESPSGVGNMNVSRSDCSLGIDQNAGVTLRRPPTTVQVSFLRLHTNVVTIGSISVQEGHAERRTSTFVGV